MGRCRPAVEFRSGADTERHDVYRLESKLPLIAGEIIYRSSLSQCISVVNDNSHFYSTYLFSEELFYVQ